MKKVIAYLPLFGSTSIHPKVFKAFIGMLADKINGFEIIPFIHTVGPSLDYNRNDAIERILQTHNPDFIMFCDADNIMPHRIISKLLTHMSDESIGAVSGLYFKKAFPHAAVQGHFAAWDENLEKKRNSLKSQDLIAPDGSQCLYYQPLRSFEAIQPIDVFGMGIVIIRSSVFMSIKQPYFKYLNPYISGDHTIGMATEDMWFCGLLKKAGIKVLCDTAAISAHIVEKLVVCSEMEESCV